MRLRKESLMLEKRNKPGFWSLWNYGDEVLEELRKKGYPCSMAKHTNKRVPILGFWRKFGLNATKEAFNISRATLYRWQKEKREGQLRPRATVPKRKRKRTVDQRLVDEIIRLRTEHYRLGKDKVQPLLMEVCLGLDLTLPSISTIGRVIKDLREAGRLPCPRLLRMSARTGKLLEKKRVRKKKKRRGSYVPKKPGDLLQLDTVITVVDGSRRYTLTAIDLTSRFAFAWTYTTGSSRNAADFLTKLQRVAPFTIKHIQTDNGSEFLKDFSKLVGQQDITHFFNWARYPKGNAHVERFNRTIQEEFLGFKKRQLLADVEGVNSDTIDWLIWYNTKRPHYALKQVSPMSYLKMSKKSHMYWTHTSG